MKYPYNTASPDRYSLLKELAKEQKKYPTEAESHLWNHISHKQLGVKFNRQHIIGDYIVDFVCIEKQLVIEVDGEYHNDAEQKQKDQLRTDALARMGFHVMRFRNQEVLLEIERVLDTITDEIEKKG